LAGGIGAVVRHAVANDAVPAAAETTGYAASAIHRAHPLEFRIDGDWRPDLSDGSARALVRSVLEFVHDEHPNGLTVTFWNLHPSRMPFLERHLELVVEHLFRGIAACLDTRPVDPILVLALLYNESRFHPKVVSPAGAVGIAQFMPDTAGDYGLAPVARATEWTAFRESRAAYREARADRVRTFRARHGGIAFDADAVIRRAVATGSTEVLVDYRALTDEDDPSAAALEAYVRGLEADFAAHEFFWDGRSALEALDARVGYRPVEAATAYLARALAAYQGLASTAVAAYNAGPDAVRARSRESILYRFGELPSYAETVRYVQRFLAVYSAIKYRLYRVREATPSTPPPPGDSGAA